MRILSVLSLVLVMGCTNSVKPRTANTVIQLGASDANVVAVIGEEKISEKEFLETMDLEIKGQFSQAHQQYRDAKEGALTQMVFEKLLEREAQDKGITKEEVFEKEIVGKTAKISDKEIAAFYEDAKKRFTDAGREAPPLDDQIKGQIRDSLQGEKSAGRQQAYVQELFAKYNAAVVLPEPIRFEVGKGTNPPKGKEGASVTIVEFSDFHCPFCKKGSDNMKDVMKKYGNQVEYRYRDYPLEQIHPRAKAASLASRCAGDQGKFWEFHDKIFENQSLKEDEEFEQIAQSIGLKMDEYKACVEDQKHMASVEQDIQEGQLAGVRGTPAYFINGVFVSGAVPAEKIIAIVEKELQSVKN